MACPASGWWGGSRAPHRSDSFVRKPNCAGVAGEKLLAWKSLRGEMQRNGWDVARVWQIGEQELVCRRVDGGLGGGAGRELQERTDFAAR